MENEYGGMQYLHKVIAKRINKNEYRTIDFIIARLLTKNGQKIKFINKKEIYITIIGTFRRKYHILDSISKMFSEYFIEMKIFPNIHILTVDEIEKNKPLHGMEGCVILYDRKRNLH